MSVPRLKKSCLFLRRFVDCVIHKHLTRYVCEARIQTASNEYAAIVEPDRHRIALEIQIVWNKFLRPMVLRKIVAENELGVVAIPKEVTLCDWFDLIVVEFESMLIRELNNAVLLTSNRFEKLV